MKSLKVRLRFPVIRKFVALPGFADVLYIKGLAAPFTANTMPEELLKVLAAHDRLGTLIPADSGKCKYVPGELAKASIDIDGLSHSYRKKAPNPS